MTPSSDPHTLTGPYVLDALSPAERIGFEQHLASCTACEAEVTELREAVTTLATQVATPPPPHLKASVMSAISHVQQLPGQDLEPAAAHQAPPVGARRRVDRRSVLTLAAALLAVAASGGIAIDQYRDNTATTRTSNQLTAILAEPDARTVHGAVAGGGQATVVVSNQKDAAVVVLHNLGDLPSDQTYQLWLIDSSKTAHSIGLAGAGQNRSQTQIVASGVTGKVAFGLTIEPKGGSAKPTMPAAVIIPMA